MKGAIVKQKYKIIKVLGQGSLTETFLAKSIEFEPFKRYAIKKFRPILGNPQAKAVKDLFYQEADILQLLSGKSAQIPLLYDYFVDGEDFYLVREWIEGLTLEQKVQQQGKLLETEVVKILNSTLSVLKYIHANGIVYRQLSPSSIVLRQLSWRSKAREEVPVLIYFSGVTKLTKKNQRWNQRDLVLANQKEYVAPEQKKGESAYANDLYSLGLTAIYLLTGKTPAELNSDPYTNRLLWHQEIPELTSNLVRVIDRAISPNVSDRFTSAPEMLDALSPQSVTISESLITQPEAKSRLTSEVKIITALLFCGLGVMGVAFAMLNLDFDTSNIEPTEQIEPIGDTLLNIATTPTEYRDRDIPQAVLNIPVFRVGTPQEQLINSLGKPTLESKGYWGESRAFLYKDFVPKVDLGFLSDIKTKKILQTEISFPQSINEAELQQVLRQLLMVDYSAEIELQIKQVVDQTSDTQKFSVNNLQGIIQRNSENRVYLAVWETGFH